MKYHNNLGRYFALALVTTGLTFGFAQQTFAAAPANSTITNTASLNYTGLTTPITASVDITVSLVASAPILSAPTDNTVAEGQPSSVTYTLTATSNGPDSYLLGSGLTPTNLTGLGTAGYTPGTVALGATSPVSLANTGATVITVPSDGANDGSINGIVAGDTIVIGANTYTVASVIDNATGTSSITLTSALVANATVGVLIAEQQSFSMAISTVGTVTTPGNAASVSTVTTATSVADGAQVSTDTHVTNVVEVIFEKLVRNVTTPTVGGTPTTINGANYFPTAGNVSAAATEVLEYVIRVTAPAGSPIAGATFTDAVPTFTTYVANSTRLNTITVNGDGATSPLVAGLTVDDNATRVAGAVATGSIAAGASAVVIFQVTVD